MTPRAGARTAIPALVASLVALYGFGILDHDLWTPDEPRVASVGLQVSQGAWVVPTLNGAPFLEQPPLHAWCTALLYRTFGAEPAAIARIASAFFGLGGLALTALLAAHLARREDDPCAGRRAGIYAALTLGLASEYFTTSHRVVVDGALAFFTTASACALVRGLASSSWGGRTGWMALGYGLASSAFLAKGLIGLAAPGLALLAMIAAMREPRRLFQSRLWLAPLMFAIVAGPWLYLLHREMGADGLKILLVDNTLGRVLPAEPGTRSHLRDAWFYCLYLPVGLLPGLVFVAGGILRRVTMRRSIEPRDRLACDFALWWLLAGFVLLSLASTKRQIYIVPFFPAAAILGAFWLESFTGAARDGGYERAVARILPGLLLCLAALAPAAACFVDGASLPWAAGSAAVSLAAAAWAWRAARRGERSTLLAAWTVGLALAITSIGLAFIPAIDAAKSLAGISRQVAAVVPADRPICALDPDETTRGMIPLYAGRPLRVLSTIEELEKLLAREGEVYILTVDKRERSPTKSDAFRHLRPTVLLEDVREGSRAFRVHRITTAGG